MGEFIIFTNHIYGTSCGASVHRARVLIRGHVIMMDIRSAVGRDHPGVTIYK